MYAEEQVEDSLAIVLVARRDRREWHGLPHQEVFGRYVGIGLTSV